MRIKYFFPTLTLNKSIHSLEVENIHYFWSDFEVEKSYDMISKSTEQSSCTDTAIKKKNSLKSIGFSSSLSVSS